MAINTPYMEFVIYAAILLVTMLIFFVTLNMEGHGRKESAGNTAAGTQAR